MKTIMQLRRVYTVNAVNVDSAVNRSWEANMYGVKDILACDLGVRITWNQGSTLVPWSNVCYAVEYLKAGEIA